MDQSGALRTSAKRRKVDLQARQPAKPRHGRRAVSATAKRSTSLALNAKSESSRRKTVYETPKKTAGPSLKKSVRFADSVIEPASNKENSHPFEDELFQATITPTPKKSAKSVSLYAEFSEPQTAGPSKSSLKRKLELSPERPPRPAIRDAAQPTLSNLECEIRASGRGTAKQPGYDSRLAAPAIPDINPASPLFAQSLLTPAKRPIQPLKNTTPAIRRAFSGADAIPSTPSISIVAPASISSVRRQTTSSDIFSSSDSFVQAAPPSHRKGWIFGTTEAAAAINARSAGTLATPARRPINSGLFSSSTVSRINEETRRPIAPLTCPPKRVAGLSSSLDLPPDRGIPNASKLNGLATPARRPAAPSNFAQPTQASLARQTPPRVSPLKEAPRRPGGSPLKTPISIADLRERQPPAAGMNSPSPLRSKSRLPSPVKAAVSRDDVHHRRSSPTRLIQTERKSTVSILKGSPSAACPETERSRRSVSFKEPSRDSIGSHSAIPVNRRLSFAATLSPKRDGNRKSQFDIYVDKEPHKKNEDLDGLGEDSMTTEEVFGCSPPKTLGTRRESGIFLSSPDRCVSIGPFTTRLSGKISPLRKEYEADLAQEPESPVGRVSTGNVFLDSMEETPVLVHKETCTVPLKDAASTTSASSSALEKRRAKEIASPRNKRATLSRIEEAGGVSFLQGLNIYLDICTQDGSDATSTYKDKVKEFGGKVAPRLSLGNPEKVDLVIFSLGSGITLQKARAAGVPCVELKWMFQCIHAADNATDEDRHLVERPSYDDYLLNHRKDVRTRQRGQRNMIPTPVTPRTKTKTK
ncbi:hypothetical protein ABW19_dt0206728 [Dactylella cylindrospora]|nr:hypothetical protein ABW19_dt0206728 [Dactylella cylindrospora]